MHHIIVLFLLYYLIKVKEREKISAIGFRKEDKFTNHQENMNFKICIIVRQTLNFFQVPYFNLCYKVHQIILLQTKKIMFNFL